MEGVNIMPNITELRTLQKDEFFDLLKLRWDMEKAGSTDFLYLDRLIIKKKAIMFAEDVAYVEKVIAAMK
jgi:hypothetical protein